MYNEFFIREFIRPLLTTYALTHTIVCSMLSMALFSAMGGTLPWQLASELLLFSLSCWFTFNIFEFGRKTFAGCEERAHVDSYSQVWGRGGAVVLLLAMAFFAALALLGIKRIAGFPLFFGLAAVNGAVACAATIYLVLNTAGSAKLYRGICLGYIILIQLTVVAAYYMSH